MNIMLGNLNVQQIEERLGINFPDEIRAFMKENHHQSANNVPSGKWHCFDIPFNLVCGDYDTAVKIHNSVADQSSKVKEALQISIQND